MKIALDIDDCLFAWSDYAHQACVDAGITNGAEITQWSFEKDYGITRDRLWQVLFAAYRDGMLLHEPYEGVRAILTALQEEHGHSIHLITARGSEARWSRMVRDHTNRWLYMWKVPHDSLTFTTDKSMIRCDAFLDDAPKNVFAVKKANPQARCVLQRRPHNHHVWGGMPTAGSLLEFALELEPHSVALRELLDQPAA